MKNNFSNFYKKIKEREYKAENLVKDYLQEFQRLEVFIEAKNEGYDEELLKYVEAAARVQAYAVCEAPAIGCSYYDFGYNGWNENAKADVRQMIDAAKKNGFVDVFIPQGLINFLLEQKK